VNGRGDLTFERACRIAMWIVVALAVLIIALPFVAGGERLTGTLAFRQDLYVAPVLLAIFILAQRWLAKGTATKFWPSKNPYWVGGILALVLLVGWAGHYVVFDGYDLSRDEQMASFDAAIFRNGHLFAPIPLAWRPISEALNLVFILPIGAREYWVSSYLPVHSAWRAALSFVADPALASPLMATMGGFFIWRIARLLWPASASTQLVCVLLYACSSQVLVMSMTAFSMSMHFALNMLWLWLFLIDRRRTHVAAMVVGWFAAGIHQPVFHAMFVLPFFLMLLGLKRWKLLAAYVAVYVCIGAFWLAWPIWISSHGAAAAVAIQGTGGVGFLDRLRSILGGWKHDPPWIMSANLLRLICWQHPLLLPLAIVGISLNFRKEPLCRALAISFILPILVTAILLPWQGYGWGYRYVQPALGCLILLGGYGWSALESAGLNLRPAMIRVSAVAALFIFPFFAATAHSIVSPFATLHSRISAIPADIVVVDTNAAPYSDDLVFNPADLSNRPITLLAGSLKPTDLERVCRLGSVGFVSGERLAPIAKLYGTDVPRGPTPEMAALMSHAADARCRVVSSANP